MARDEHVVYLDGRGGAADAAGIRARFRRIADDHLLARFRTMLEAADQHLSEKAEAVVDPDDRTAYLAFAAALRRQRFAIEKRFGQALFAAHERAWNARDRGPLPDADPDTLSLVAPDVLERDLATEAMVSRARNRYRVSLENLCRRLSRVVVGGAQIDASTNPVDPRQIAAAMREATDSVDAELAPRRTLYALFERHLLEALDTMYEALERVLPQEAARSPEPRTTSAPRHARAKVTEEIGRTQAQALIRALHALLGRAGVTRASEFPETAFAGVDESAPSGGSTAGLGDVVAVLSALQHLPVVADNDEVGYIRPAEIRRRVREALAGRGTERMDALQACTIEIVSLVFDAVLHDDNIPDPMKVLLARLQIPVVKVALMEPELFSRRDHPARRLVNRMAQAAVTWTDDGKPADDPLFHCMEETVSGILEEFTDSSRVFERRLEAFEAFREAEAERARQVETRTRAVAEGRARLHAARQRAAEEIALRCAGRRVPPAVQRILDGPWARVLSLILLREGEESETWKQRLETTERLLFTVQPCADQEERRSRVLEIPPLLQELRVGMDAVMVDPAEMTALFKELEQEHIRALARPPRKPPPDAAMTPPAVEEKQSDPRLARWLQRVDGIPLDCWLEWRQPQRKPLRGRLAARLADGGWLVLVNRAGFRVTEFSRTDMAKDLAAGRLRQLDDAPLFDKALSRVVSSLRARVAVNS